MYLIACVPSHFPFLTTTTTISSFFRCSFSPSFFSSFLAHPHPHIFLRVSSPSLHLYLSFYPSPPQTSTPPLHYCINRRSAEPLRLVWYLQYTSNSSKQNNSRAIYLCINSNIHQIFKLLKQIFFVKHKDGISHEST